MSSWSGAITDQTLNREVESSLLFSFSYRGLLWCLTPTHKPTWKDECSLWPFNDEKTSLLFNDYSDAAKWWQVAEHEAIENVEEHRDKIFECFIEHSRNS
jgi:hypothetical protein